MKPFTPSRMIRWAGMCLIVGLLLGLAASPPFLGAKASAFIRLAFAPLCHQLADRSPHFHGDVIALCHRCFGMLAGFWIGLVATPIVPVSVRARASRWNPPVVILLACLPAVLDWSLGATHLWTNTPLSRTGTGFVIGLAAGFYLALALVHSTKDVRFTSPNLLTS